MINAQSLPGEVQKMFSPYLEKLISLHGDNLLSVFIYGSATGKNYHHKISDINSVCVFRQLDFIVFQKSLKIISAGLKQRIVAPLFFTPENMRSSLDVFPIEFLDMKENYVVVFGHDYLSELEIKAEYLRLFCEQQIKGKLIRIRQAYLEVGTNKKGMEALLKDSLNSLLPVFRNLIRLKGKMPPIDKIEVLRQLVLDFNLDEKVFIAIYKDSRNDEKIAGQDVELFLSRYISQIEKLAESVDKL